MSIAKKLTVYSVNLNDMKKTELARFELENDEVKATYKSMLLENELKDGIYDRGKMVEPKDGAKFMEALERAYATASAVTVERE